MHLSEKFFLSIVLNSFITIAEIVGGILSGSLALISDAVHNLTDVVSLIIGYLGERFSQKQLDKFHTFGFKRTEVVTAFLNGVFLFVIAGWLIIEAFKRILSPGEINLKIMLIASLIGLIGNFISIILLHSHREQNLNVKAAYLHLFFDTISSVFVVLAVPLIYFTGIRIVDPLVTFIIVGFIIKSSYNLVKNTFHILVMGVPADQDIELIARELEKIYGIENIHHIHLWSVDSKNAFISLHAVTSRHDTDKLIEEINSSLREKFGISHTTIQVENKNLCDEDIICNQ